MSSSKVNRLKRRVKGDGEVLKPHEELVETDEGEVGKEEEESCLSLDYPCKVFEALSPQNNLLTRLCLGVNTCISFNRV